VHGVHYGHNAKGRPHPTLIEIITIPFLAAMDVYILSVLELSACEQWELILKEFTWIES
jgi:hypothetical protein